MTMAASDFFSLAQPPSARVEAAFFTALKTGNRTFKKTGAGRFSELDAKLVQVLSSVKKRHGELLDIGISSGITTLELADALTAAGHKFRITATDLSLDAYIVDVMSGCRALVDRSGHPLQYEICGRTMRPWRRRLDYLSGMIALRGAANRILAPRARSALAAGHIVNRVRLISPRLEKRPDIAVQEDDVTASNIGFVGRFDIVRAANILNRDYFDEATLRRAIGNVTRYLSGPGALLLVARTHADGRHDATMFEVAADCRSFTVVERFGEGSEVEDLVLETKATV